MSGSPSVQQAPPEGSASASFRARSADRPSWWVRWLGVAGGGAGVVLGGVLAAGFGHLTVGGLLLVAGGAGGLAVVRWGRARSYAVTGSGLVVDGTVRPWEEFEAIESTEEALVVHEDGRFGTLRFDRSDLSDPDGVREALAEHLPER